MIGYVLLVAHVLTVMSHGRVKWHSRPQILRVLDCARHKREELWGRDGVKLDPRALLFPLDRRREERSTIFAIFFKLYE